MNPDMVLIRLGELTLKGRNRYKFEEGILANIERVLKPFPGVAVHRRHNRIMLELCGTPYGEVKKQLRKVFGISSFSPVLAVEKDLKQIREAALKTVQAHMSGPKTFKVKVKRADKSFPYPSHEMNHLIGSHVLRNIDTLRVDVHNPDIELQIDIREEGAYIFAEVERGLSGLPLGVSGRAMLMLSGGIDSPVAGWLGMKRGLLVEAVHFHSYPYTSERAKQKVLDLAGKLAEYAGEMPVHLVPFTDIQTSLKKDVKENVLIILMRRAMMRITAKLAEKRRALAILTGENLGQVASQTLPSLYVINHAVHFPVLRPLITMEKEEIIRLAREIDTYPISILPYEDCCTLFTPKTPVTNPNLRAIERMERRLSWLEEKIEEAVERTELVTVRADQPRPAAEAFTDLL